MQHTRSTQEGRGRRRWAILIGLFTLGAVASMAPLPANAAVSAVSGGAYGWKTDVSLFGGPSMVRGADPADAVVDLPSGGSTVPLVDFAVLGTGAYGPAKIYQGGPAAVSTYGDKGDALRPGVVTSSASVSDVGFWHGVMLEDTTGVWNPTVGGEMDPFIGLQVNSSCTAREGAAPSATTVILGGRVVDTDANGNATNERTVPPNPAPNTQMTGVLGHILTNGQPEQWRITFNEQTVSPDGKSITVNAVHMELLGPIAVGHMYVGQSRCGTA